MGESLNGMNFSLHLYLKLNCKGVSYNFISPLSLQSLDKCAQQHFPQLWAKTSARLQLGWMCSLIDSIWCGKLSRALQNSALLSHNSFVF